MAQNSAQFTVTAAWQSVPLNGNDNVSFTLEEKMQPVKVRIATAQPPAGETWGNTMDSVSRVCAISGLDSGQQVWVRTISGTATIVFQ